MAPKTTSSAASAPKKFYIDFSGPAADSVFDGPAFEQYMKEHIKVEGKAGNIADKITISIENDKLVIASSNTQVSKRYLKYLTKRYLKKSSSRDWLRVVANKKDSFILRYFNVSAQEEAAEE